MSDFQVADFAKNGRERIKVAVREFRGVRGLDIRTFATNPEGQAVPTSKGVNLRLGLVRELIAALQSAETALVADGSLPPIERGTA